MDRQQRLQIVFERINFLGQENGLNGDKRRLACLIALGLGDKQAFVGLSLEHYRPYCSVLRHVFLKWTWSSRGDGAYFRSILREDLFNHLSPERPPVLTAGGTKVVRYATALEAWRGLGAALLEVRAEEEIAP